MFNHQLCAYMHKICYCNLHLHLLPLLPLLSPPPSSFFTITSSHVSSSYFTTLMTSMCNHQVCTCMHKICYCNLHLHLLPLLPLLSPPPSSFFTITSSHVSSSYFTTLMTSMCNHQVCTCMHKICYCNLHLSLFFSPPPSIPVSSSTFR